MSDEEPIKLRGRAAADVSHTAFPLEPCDVHPLLIERYAGDPGKERGTGRYNLRDYTELRLRDRRTCFDQDAQDALGRQMAEHLAAHRKAVTEHMRDLLTTGKLRELVATSYGLNGLKDDPW